MKLAMNSIIAIGLLVGTASSACVVDLGASLDIRILPSEVLSKLQNIQTSYDQKLNARAKPVLKGQSVMQFQGEQQQYQQFQQQLQYMTSEATMTVLRSTLCH